MSQLQSQYDSLAAQLTKNPYDPEAWKNFIQIAEDSGNTEKINVAYDSLLKQYPHNSTAQIRYITHHVRKQDSDKVEKLFKQFLVGSPCIELWKFYLTYVQHLNSVTTQRDTIRMSYEFALNHIGQDKDSGQIWDDYIQLLQAGEAVTPGDQKQKMDLIRQVYHRAVQIPLDNVERLWQELEAFETSINKTTAKQLIADVFSAHMLARTVLRQLTNHLALLYPPKFPDMYLPTLPTFDASERALVGKWKAYLKWEENNPLGLNMTKLVSRMQGVYRKAVIYMRHYPEIWFMGYNWINNVGRSHEALSILEAGLEGNPSSFLLTFAYAESLEIHKAVLEVHKTYTKFLDVLRSNLEHLERTTGTPKFPPSSNGCLRTLDNTRNDAISESEAVGTASSSMRASNERLTGTSLPRELQIHRKEYGLVWIMYMRFGRRTEGVKGSRLIFSRARKDIWTPWEVYEAAALMEYHCSGESGIASRIFQKGMETFGDEVEYIAHYLDFLISINDENNARALFECVIPNFSPERARPLWERWAHFEYQYASLEAALKLEARMAGWYTSDSAIKRLAQRHIYSGTDAIAERDLGLAQVRQWTAQATNSNTKQHGGQGTPPHPGCRPLVPSMGLFLSLTT